MRGRRTDLPTAALVVELGETQGKSQRQISESTGVPLGTVNAILNRAHGWNEIANGPVFQRHRDEQNKALEQANRTLAKKSLEIAETKMDRASYSQLVFGAAIMVDKARLLAGESTQNIAIHAQIDSSKINDWLAQSLSKTQETIEVTPNHDGKKQG